MLKVIQRYKLKNSKTSLLSRSAFSCRNVSTSASIVSGTSSSINKDKHDGLPLDSLPSQFLRLNDSKLFDPTTHQRNDIEFDPTNGKPIISQPIAEDGDMDMDNLKVKSITLDDTNDEYNVEWEDGRISKFSSHWINTQLQRRKSPEKCQNQLTNYNIPTPLNDDISTVIPRLPWSYLKEDDIRSDSQYQKMRFPFRQVVSESPESVEKAVRSLYQYGILFVTSTPIDDDGAGVAALASALSGPAHKSSPDTTLLAHYLHCDQSQQKPSAILENGTDGAQRTMYGNVWFTNASSMVDGTSVADSAYGNEALPLHTDFTYNRDPPGLQIFTMVSPSDNGGESTFADGLAIAEYMRSNHEKEFDTLCRIRRRYRSIDDDTGWFMEGSGPVIEAIDKWQGLISPPKTNGSRWGAVVGIRHNDLDRLPDLPPPNFNHDETYTDDDTKENDTKFYDELKRAHNVWDSLLAKDEFRLVVKLNPGETAVVANQRCFHGRNSFKASNSPRSVMGCYVSQDDLESRFRWMMKGHCTFQ